MAGKNLKLFTLLLTYDDDDDDDGGDDVVGDDDDDVDDEDDDTQEAYTQARQLSARYKTCLNLMAHYHCWGKIFRISFQIQSIQITPTSWASSEECSWEVISTDNSNDNEK